MADNHKKMIAIIDYEAGNLTSVRACLDTSRL